MKKTISLLFSIVIMLSFALNASAYSNDHYSLNVHSPYSKTGEGVFSDANGQNINIQITPSSSVYSGEIYTEKNLNDLVNELITNFESIKDQMRSELSQKIGDSGFTEEEINALINNYKFDKVIAKEITTFTKNEYKCFHLIYSCSIGNSKIYQEQFSLFSGNSLITLTVTVHNPSEINSKAIKSMVDSFTLKNYSPYVPPEAFSLDTLWYKVAVGGLSGLLFSGGAILLGRRKKKLKQGEIPLSDESQLSNTDISYDSAMPDYTNKKTPSSAPLKHKVVVKKVTRQEKTESISKQPQIQYCYKCGAKLSGEGIFCSKCGAKVIKE